MNITLGNTPERNTKKKDPLQKRFDKLVNQVDRETTRLDHLKTELDALAQRMRQGMRDADAKHLPALIALAERLAVFASRKTLSDWHRRDLIDWFTCIVRRIAAVDADEADRLNAAFEQSFARLAGMELDEYREMVQDILHAREADETEDDDAPYDEEVWSQLDGFDPEPEDETADDDPFQDEPDAAPNPATPLANEAWIKRLFRKAAQQLHPDREADPQTREHKEQRMAELLAARREGDVLTLLRIYGESLGEDNLKLADEQMQALCEALQTRLDAIEREKDEFVFTSPKHSMAYTVIYSPGKQRREQNLNRWLRDNLRKVKGEGALARQLTNLTALKNRLRSRREERNDVMTALMSEILDEA